MDEEDLLIFQLDVAKGKPRDTKKKAAVCPFCDTANLTNIIRQKDDMIWLENKFRTLKDTYQTVLIESSKHYDDISTYSVQKNSEVFQFIFDCWNSLLKTNKYKSVLMYKNFGPMSGGSLRHPHFQIVGLDNVDGYQYISKHNFTGYEIWKSDNIEFNLSQEPIMGFVEFNIRIKDSKHLNDLAEFARITVRYLLNEFHNGTCDSYNIFFYDEDGDTICKIVPRFVVSPYFVGYKLPQRDNRETLERFAADILNKLKNEADCDEIKGR